MAMLRAEDGSLVPASFYSNMLRAEDGSYVPASFYNNVTIVRNATPARPPSQPLAGTTGARMHLASESGRLLLAIDVAPREIEYGGMPHDWSEAERPGDRPLLMHKGTPLRTMSFSFMITDKVNAQAPQTSKLALLRDIARTFERVIVRYSPTEQGLWRITDLKVSSEQRTNVGNEIARATVSITLTEASDPAPAVGPVSKPPPPPPAPKPTRRTHTVRKGDCLWLLAERFYGSGQAWPRLYDANRKVVEDPHLIYPGEVLVIP